MTQLQSVFLATTLKSEQAKVAQYMELMNLDRVAFFVVREPSRELQEALFEDIRDSLIARIPLVSKLHPRARRMLYICKTNPTCSDEEHIDNYRYYLHQTFGPKCRYVVRVCHRITRLVEEANHGK